MSTRAIGVKGLISPNGVCVLGLGLGLGLGLELELGLGLGLELELGLGLGFGLDCTLAPDCAANVKP